MHAHTRQVLHKFFNQAFPFTHAYRRQALVEAVTACLLGAQVTITHLGRYLCGKAGYKHKIKRMDRLIGNPRLHQELKPFYQALCQAAVGEQDQPIVLIDWSPFGDDQKTQCLRASTPRGGRAVTLYQALYPQKQLGSRRVQHRFLDTLKQFLAPDCHPIIIADAGFKTPFFNYVERLGWHWIGRLRGQGLIRPTDDSEWVSAKILYETACSKPTLFHQAQWVRNHPLNCQLVLVKRSKKGRKCRGVNGKPKQSSLSKSNARREQEPWLLAASLSLQALQPEELVKLYATRMQIEEDFRDTKSIRYGLGIACGLHTNLQRSENLLLIAAIASAVLQRIGIAIADTATAKTLRPNSSSQRPPYSRIFLARLAIQLGLVKLQLRWFKYTLLPTNVLPILTRKT